MICWHNWMKWSDLVPSYKNHKTQFRECFKCRRIQFRDLGYCDGVDAYEANRAIKDQRP